jgi:hypothetical protein
VHANAETESAGLFSLESSGCSPETVKEVRHLVRVELRNVEPGERRERLSIFFECDLEQVNIRTTDGRGETSRTIDLRGVTPSVQARVIALAIAELVRESPHADNVPQTPPDKVPPKPPPAPAPEVLPAEVPSRRRVLALAEFTNFGFVPAAMWGGAISFDYASDNIALGIGSSLVTHERHFELGDVRVLMTSLSMYAAWVAETQNLVPELGLGGCFGAARIQGSSKAEDRASSGSVLGAWAGPFLLGALSYGLSDSFVIELRARIGFVLLPVVGQVARGADIELDGIWSSLQLGFGLDL